MYFARLHFGKGFASLQRFLLRVLQEHSTWFFIHNNVSKEKSSGIFVLGVASLLILVLSTPVWLLEVCGGGEVEYKLGVLFVDRSFFPVLLRGVVPLLLPLPLSLKLRGDCDRPFPFPPPSPPYNDSHSPLFHSSPPEVLRAVVGREDGLLGDLDLGDGEGDAVGIFLR